MTDYNDGEYFTSLDMNTLKRKSEGIGVYDGLSVTTSATSLTVSVLPGQAVVGADGTVSRYSVSTTNSFLLTADGSNPRKAIVYMDSSGNLSYAQGTAQAAVPVGAVGRNAQYPFPPAIPAGATLLSEIWIPAGATTGPSLTLYNPGPITIRTAHTGADYTLFKSGSTYYARKESDGTLPISGASVTSVIQSVNTALGVEGGTIYSEITNDLIDFRIRHHNRAEAVTCSQNAYYNMYTRSGAGRITHMWVTMEHQGNFDQDVFRFIIDGVTTSVYNADLFGFWGASKSNEKFSYHAAHIGGNCDNTNYYGGGWITFPINFKTNCSIDFYPPSLSTWSTNSKLFYHVYSENLAENDRTTRIQCEQFSASSLAYGGTLTMSSCSGKPGRFLFVMLSEYKAGGLDMLENDLSFVVDGTEHRSTGTEDFFLHSEYYQANESASYRRCIGPHVGIIRLDLPNLHHVAFRDLLGEQGGIPWTDSFYFKLNYDETRSSSVAISYGYTTIWEEF